MMSGRLYIDGGDAYLGYGIMVVQGGWNDLLSYPPLKAVKSNDWQEEDGIEPDLSDPKLNTRDITVNFALVGVHGNYSDFLELLSDKAYHDFDCVEIGRSFKLRLVSHSSLDLALQIGFLSVRFADDFPMSGYEYQAPTGGGVSASDDYSLDEVPLTDYGVRVLQGSLDEIKKGGAVKPALLRNIASQGGAQYDADADVHYKSKDVKLSCLLRADSLEEMWRNYYALLHDLTQPDEHLLYVNELDKAFPCCYKSGKVTDFSPVGRVWLQFTLTLTFIRDFRFDELMILATENDIDVYTEDGENAIDVRPDR